MRNQTKPASTANQPSRPTKNSALE